MLATFGLLFAFGLPVLAGNSIPGDHCNDLPSHADLLDAMDDASPLSTDDNGGFGLDMWTTVVNRDGVVCEVGFTGGDRGDQWPASRVISAQKAVTANSLSLPGLALSTANLWAAVQPGGSLYGLQHSNPVNADVAYGGNSQNYGQDNDPMGGEKVGGVNVFGGGLALYNSDGEIVGALGASGDTSCKDHNFAWRVRNNLGLDFVTGGVSGDVDRPDNIIFDVTGTAGHESSASGFGHPHCGPGSDGSENDIVAALPAISTP